MFARFGTPAWKLRKNYNLKFGIVAEMEKGNLPVEFCRFEGRAYAAPLAPRVKTVKISGN